MPYDPSNPRTRSRVKTIAFCILLALILAFLSLVLSGCSVTQQTVRREHMQDGKLVCASEARSVAYSLFATTAGRIGTSTGENGASSFEMATNSETDQAAAPLVQGLIGAIVALARGDGETGTEALRRAMPQAPSPKPLSEC